MTTTQILRFFRSRLLEVSVQLVNPYLTVAEREELHRFHNLYTCMVSQLQGLPALPYDRRFVLAVQQASEEVEGLV